MEVEVTVETKNIDDKMEQDETKPDLVKMEVHKDNEERKGEMQEEDFEDDLQREFRN